MKELLLFVFAVLCFTGCDDGKLPQATVETSNDTYQVDFLFEKGGAKVYRFYDKHEYRYFVTVPGRVSTLERTTHSNGKTTTTDIRAEEIETVETNGSK